MSLARLLAVGKSVVGISGGDSRYRMKQKRLLPKFGAKKNPFLSRTKGTVETERQIEPELKVEPERKVEPVGKTQRMQEREQPQPQACPPQAVQDGVVDKSSVSTSDRGLCAWLGLVKKGLSCLVKWPGHKRQRSPFGQKAFQSELNLDTVKVVRNDLSSASDDLFGRRALSGRFESEPLDEGVFRKAGAMRPEAREDASQPGAGALRRRRFFGLWPSRETDGVEVGATKT